MASAVKACYSHMQGPASCTGTRRVFRTRDDGFDWIRYSEMIGSHALEVSSAAETPVLTDPMPGSTELFQLTPSQIDAVRP